METSPCNPRGLIAPLVGRIATSLPASLTLSCRDHPRGLHRPFRWLHRQLILLDLCCLRGCIAPPVGLTSNLPQGLHRPSYGLVSMPPKRFHRPTCWIHLQLT
eukprot:8756238-Karenia_brevis.AAC.1